MDCGWVHTYHRSWKNSKVSRTLQRFFRILQNQPCPLNTVAPPPASKDLGISLNTPMARDVASAIRSLKNVLKGKRYWRFSLKKLKVDRFNEVWKREEISNDCRNGLIVKISKKRDISVCNNSRGITLLSISSMVFCRVILNRTGIALDQRNREEKAGIRAERGCSNQIFNLRNIVEHFVEWNAIPFVYFIEIRPIMYDRLRNQCDQNESDVYQKNLVDAPLTVAGKKLECVESLTTSELW